MPPLDNIQKASFSLRKKAADEGGELKKLKKMS
jgi:hypothetical protein